MGKGLLFIISGPAGSGKGTVVKKILEKHPEVKLSISMTTRNPRPIETPDVEYYFVTKEYFKECIENDKMLEYAEYNGNFYGTPRTRVEENLDKGHDVILEIEVEGAMQVKAKYPEKSIWAFSGYLFDRDILSGKLGRKEITEEYLSYLDVLVDGPFIEEKKDLMLRFRGSSNQRIIDVPASLRQGSVVLWQDWQGNERGMK